MSKEGDQRPSILGDHEDPFEKLPSEGTHAIRTLRPSLMDWPYIIYRAIRSLKLEIVQEGNKVRVTMRRVR